MTLKALCLTALTAASLSGCAAITSLSEASRPLEIYELRTPEIAQAPARRGAVELVVEEPIASGSLATERIMIRPGPLQAQYLPGVRWSDTAPVMLQTLLVRTLTQTGAFASVGRRPLGSHGDYALLGELTDFQAEAPADAETATVRLRVVFRLVREDDASVAATRSFEVTEPAASPEPEDVVAAFDRATQHLLSEITDWVVTRRGLG
ncbi:ABC-type transport auxiliary lipoprotein family protein [Salipiger mucosus]|uniref:ABC-type transport auxiliary lipoprotein component domain-containing protein n=1 Tax=Salipiger mucosus DSM 16094 TaxID=1123237 RepID=S9QBP0_9RHOB|nr:ABC-type transport auxiliary lipoprotein family protein [Salipiger mucosus]EPX78831.1 hypothetical protein Salmuc_04414 [Salipiger mucosus DSM 16094]